jgi:hypothetical protein
MVDSSKIRERMGVIAADGRRIGFVDCQASSGKLKLTSLAGSHGYHHLIPLAWVEQVDRYVHLSKESRFVAANWEQAH